MKKVFLVLIFILSILFFSVSKNINLYVTESKLYKAESVTLREETGFAINNRLLTGIEAERTVSDFDLGLDTKYTTVVTDKNGNIKTSGYIFTGDIIQIKNNNEIVSSPKVVIKGDVNSDGKISPLDYVVIKNHIMQSTLISGDEYLSAADFDSTGSVVPLDYVKVKNYIMDRSEEKYTIKYNANGGSGSVSSQQVVKGETTNVRRNTFTKEGSKFISWNTKTDGSGTTYKEVSKIKVTKNVTLYAQWEDSVHTLSIKYNGNGGTWNTPKYDTYSYDSKTGYVTKDGDVYIQTVKYGDSLPKAGLVNHNGSYTNWSKKGNSVPLGKEYYIDGTDVTLDQTKQYSAIELANLVNCDLKKTDCSITIKVNWMYQLIVGSFNIGMFQCGTWINGCSTTPDKIVNIIKKYKFDIIGLQEAKSYDVGSYTLYAQQISRNSGLTNNYITVPNNVNALLSKYTLSNKSSTALTGGQPRSFDKTVINVNGVKISFYNTHLGLDEYNEGHFAKIAEVLSKDSNPIIVTGDFNSTTIDNFDKYLKPLGFEIAAYDNTTKNMWKKVSYCDLIIVLSKGHIDLGKFESVEQFKINSDHNLLVAQLFIH